KYDDDWVGRYHAVVSDLQIVNFNPSLGYKVNDNLSLGGGVDMMLAHVQLTQAIDFGAICLAQFTSSICQGLGALPQQADGFGDLEGDNFDDVALGYNLGLKYKLSDTSSLGITYRSEVDIDVDGDADFSVPAAGAFVFASNLFLDTGLEASVTLPASFSISYANQVDNITYLADITWTGWSSFEELRIEYDNSNQPTTVNTYAWEDVYRYSFGIDYQYSDDTVYRFGLALDESPVPSPERRTPRLPGNDRTWVSFGVSKQLDNSMSIDVGYSHLFIDDAEIENEVESSIPTLASTLDGEYEASVDIFSVQLTWQY
nr:outer membrane protein transport protein [Gammaproteobacteria bacterium]